MNLKRPALVNLLTLAVLSPALTGLALAAADYGFTPRPEAVRGLEPPVLPLEGAWKFRPAPPQGFWALNERAAASWPVIRIPGDWTMQGFSVKPGTAAGYIKTVTIPKSWAGCRILLRFDGVQSEAKVWVNGRLAGSHAGGFNAFELDISALVRPGAAATIAVSVRNESLADELASATQYAAYQIGGITRKAGLMAVPEIHLSRLRIETGLDGSHRDARLKVGLTLANAGSKTARQAEVGIALLDPSGNAVPLAAPKLDAWDLAPGAAENKSIEADVPAPLLWDAEHPRLHTLVVSLKVEGRIIETVRRRFGFREVEAAGTRLYVNGMPVKLRGVNRHETHPLLGRSLTPDLERRDAELFRDANVNYIRTSHYPPAEEFLDACDELGLFVECEAPLVWIGHGANARWKSHVSDEPKLYPFLERAIGEMIAFHERHPSVILWSLANESAWGPNWARAKAYADALDPTRPKTFHDQAYGAYNNFGSKDMAVANFHYPGPQGPELALDFARPLLYGEYVHLNCYNRAEIQTDPGVRDEWGRGLHRQWERIFGSAVVIGGAVWSGLDDVFQLPSGRAAGYGEWGPLDGWRRPKPEYWHIRKSYSPVRVKPETIPLPAPGRPIKVEVENRHDFTNLSEMRIEWRLGEAHGTVRLDLPPRRSGVLAVPAPVGKAEGRTLRLEFWSPRGFAAEEVEIPVGGRTVPDPPFAPAVPGSIKLKEEAGRFIAAGPSIRWAFDQLTGTLLGAEADGIPVLAGGPVLMLLPLTSSPCAPDFAYDVKPLNETCSGWTAESVQATQEEGAVVLAVKGRFKEARGGYRIRIDGAGRADIEYAFTLEEAMNPRQWGLVLYLPREMDILDWNRRGLWSVYPGDHIGRLRGTAKALTAGRDFRFRMAPEWAWKDDQTGLGSNDFRSTKTGLDWAALTSAKGYGVLLHSNGPTAARAFLDGNRTGWLVAGFSTGGGDAFYAPHHRTDDKPLAKGDAITGGFSIRLLAGPR
ncbi:MAG: glycoside hydrolase family 2 TIM barrel-domain containing protein [Acidobacteriota bacterium]|nr:glycoside hydrolase family 2 TIM barrel-domain containing protein [Acidobacteriota bacterium]